MKTIFGDIISGEFKYHRHGYDFCVITLGASISAISLQLLSTIDLFPGITPSGWLGKILVSLTNDPATQRLILLFVILLWSCFGALLTAYICKAIRNKKTKYKDLLSCINFSVGTGLFGIYIFMLITKV